MEEGRSAPPSSAINDIQPDPGGFISLLVLDMDAYAEKTIITVAAVHSGKSDCSGDDLDAHHILRHSEDTYQTVPEQFKRIDTL